MPLDALRLEGEGESGEHDRRSRATRRVGSVLLGRFELNELIGVGAFGEVYRAHDRQHPKAALAIKILTRPSPHALYLFKREFRSLSAWSHPNLVALHELFLDDEVAFFTMELVPGVDFSRYVRPAGLLDAARLTQALRALVEGVSALHARGYVHRDLKPSNVLVDADGRLVIVDLGLARLFEPGDAHGSENGFTGTVGYAAPEQLALEQVGPEADWYAVGTMLYEALTGALPHDGPFAEVARQKRARAPQLGRMDAPLEGLRRACEALLEPVPAQRAGAELLRSVLGQPTRLVRSADPALVGRGAELARLRDVFEQVERGASRVVVVEGSSGLGKTTLVEHFLSELRVQHRAIVLSGRCYVNEDVTYQAVDGSIDALSHHLRALSEPQIAALLPRDVRSLARLFPVLNRIERIAMAPPVRSLEDKIGLRERAAVALRELLARLSDRLPPVLFIDDVQWDDADSAWLLSTLLAVPDPPALMLILTCRSEEQPKSRLLSELRQNPLTERLIQHVKLRALSKEETRQLVLRALPSAQHDPQLSQRVAEESDGHPMFAIELAHFAQQRAAGSPYVGQVSLDDALRSRAQRVSAPALRLLEVVSVAGSPLASSAALAAADCEPDARRELLLDKLITASGAHDEGTLSACHDRVREAIVASLSEPRLCTLHARLAQALLSNEPRFERVVEHYLAAGERGEAARYALPAAEQASAALAFHRVPDLLLLALEAVVPAERGPLYLRLGESYALLGRTSEAARAYAEAAALQADPGQRWELESLAMWQALHAGDYTRGYELLQRLEKQLGGRGVRPSVLRLLESAVRWPCWWLFGPPRLAPTPSTDASAHKRLRLCQRAFLGMLDARTLVACYYAFWTLLGAARLGDRSVYATMLAMFVVVKSVMRGRSSANDQRLLSEAAELAKQGPDEVVRLLVATCQACCAFSIGQNERAASDFWALTETEIPATPFGKFLHSVVLGLAAPLLFVSGHIDRAKQFAAGAIARVHEGGDAHTESALRMKMAFRLLADDEDELAVAEWSAARDRFPSHEVLRWVPSVVPALYAGNLGRAEEILRLARRYLFHWEIYLDTGRAQYLWWWGGVACARLAAGERRFWLFLRLRLARMLLAVRTPPSAAPARDALAAAHAFARGDRARGLARLVAAQAGFEASGARMFAACASHVLSTLHPDPSLRASHAARAQAVFELEKIKRPDKWVQALLPGIPTGS